MIYIRTKNGKVYCFTDIHIVGDTIIGYVNDNDKNALDGGTYLAKENVVAQTNTIEELIDELVIDNPENWAKKPFVTDQNFDTFLNETNARFQKQYNIKTYGAIWTDKGLIYVAKMNDKGELELL